MPDELLKSMVFVLPSLLHYHFPRFQRLADICRQADIAFTQIELCSHLKAYPWLVNEEHQAFTNITLFPDQYLDQIPNDQLWEALRSHLEALHPDVLFLYGYSLAVYRKARSWAQKQDVATVILSDSNSFDKRRFWPFEWLKSLVVSQFDAAFVGGTSSLEYIQTLGIPAERCVIGFDVIDTEFFARRAYKNLDNLPLIRQKWNLPDKYFLFVGRLIPEKNLLGLLYAYQRYSESKDQNGLPWDLVICGGGPEEGKIKANIQSLPDHVRRQVHLVGHVDQPEVIALFTCSTCLVLPSFSESWGLVVNEAMACGIPVLVSSRAGCAKDLAQNDVNGWIFDPMNMDQLASRMTFLGSLNESTLVSLGQSGKEIIADWGLERFSLGALTSAGIAVAHRRGA